MSFCFDIKKYSVLMSYCILLCLTSSAQAAKKNLSAAGFEIYVATLKVEALDKGYDTALVNNAFSQVKFHQRAVKADRSQPETVETLDTYLPKRVPDWKVNKARALYKEHLPLLTKIGKEYNVQPRFIVALWGLETNFGKIMGNYNVISALTTLAY
ncbi:MAG: membrane-bound lytic murein transglycosylase B, partial [Colwellia sp.]